MTASDTYVTDGDLTRAIKAALRKAFHGSKFTVMGRQGRIEWTDDGPAVEQVENALISADCTIVETYKDGTLSLHGRYLYLDRYNVAERAAEEKDRERRRQEYKAQEQRETAAVAAAAQAKRDAIRSPERPWALNTSTTDQQAAGAAFEKLRQLAEAAVATDAERQHRPSWAPPLILQGELLEACIALDLLKPDDKPIARLWAGFADPKKTGRSLRERGLPYQMPEIACRGFELHAGSERGTISAILFEAQRAENASWRFGPNFRETDYRSPRSYEWERLIRAREANSSPSRLPRSTPKT